MTEPVPGSFPSRPGAGLSAFFLVLVAFQCLTVYAGLRGPGPFLPEGWAPLFRSLSPDARLQGETPSAPSGRPPVLVRPDTAGSLRVQVDEQGVHPQNLAADRDHPLVLLVRNRSARGDLGIRFSGPGVGLRLDAIRPGEEVRLPVICRKTGRYALESLMHHKPVGSEAVLNVP